MSRPYRLLVLTLLLASSAALAEARPGGTLVIIDSQVPRHLNPAVQSGTATAVPGTQLFATPLRFDENWNPEPYLAERWDVAEDGLSVTLHLRSDALFHDGTPVTAGDLAFSLQTVKENHPFQTMFAPVIGVDTPDAHTAVIRLDRPHPALLLAMSSALLPVIPEHIYGDGQDPKSHPRNADPVGSGPFKLVEFKQGEHIILERFEDFFLAGRPYLDRIVIRVIADLGNRVISMERGDGHLMPFMTNLRDIKRLQGQDHLGVTERGYAAVGPINWLAFNTAKAPFDDPRVRRAVAYAVDREFITGALHLGLSRPATGPIVPDSPFYTAEVATYDLDLERAGALLDEAGHTADADGTRFSATVDYIPGLPEQQKNLAEYLKSQLAKIGIDVQVRAAPDFPTWSNRVSNHDFDMSMDLVFNWGDPVIGVHRTYLGENIRKGVIWSNTQSYRNPAVDEILARAGVATDAGERAELYGEFQQLVAEDLPIYWINVVPYHTVYHQGLGNVPMSIWGAMAPLDQVYWDTPPE